MIEYPKQLDILFKQLLLYGAKPIIIGGFVRDFLLGIPSKDIDIEVYHIASFTELEKVLGQFGTINSVGKSFGVCKLQFEGIEIDFTLPRTESKIAMGHKGFDVTINPNLDFHSAFLRRDFTINAIGFDIAEKKILDPFHGMSDLKNKILRAVDVKTFMDDPLRILRAVQFYARFHLKIDNSLLKLCQNMVEKNILKELPKDRIFEEIKKLLLKSEQPSLGFKLLEKFGAYNYFVELQEIEHNNYEAVLKTIDSMKKLLTSHEKTNIVLMLASVCSYFNSEQTIRFIQRLTHEKQLLAKILPLIENIWKIDFIYSNGFTNSQLYELATKVNIEELLILSKALNLSKDSYKEDIIKKRVIELNILNQPMTPLLLGRDILTLKNSLKLKIQPSKQFATILEKGYQAQINEDFFSHEEALAWLRRYLLQKNNFLFP